MRVLGKFCPVSADRSPGGEAEYVERKRKRKRKRGTKQKEPDWC